MLHATLGRRDEVSHRQFLDRARQAFLGGTSELDGVDPDILGSWRRARDTFGIDPGQPRCGQVLAHADLEQRRQHDDGYGLALPLLRDFGAQLAPTGHVLAWFDPRGWMLSLGGDPHVAERIAEINFSPGANWSEASVGTNGPGTALAARRPVKVFATEHYVEAWQAWTCSAAPVLDPGSGDLLGVVDITGPWQTDQLHSLVAARAIAFAIQQRLQAARRLRDEVIAFAFRDSRGAEDGLVAVDRAGRVVAANETGQRRLGFAGLDVPPVLREVLGSAIARANGDRREREVAVTGPGGGTVRLLSNPITHEGDLVGAVLRVITPAPGRQASRPAALRAGAQGARYDFTRILGHSESVAIALQQAHVAARNDLPVVLFGESGTGKELFAQAIHAASARAGGPFVAVNCGAIPGALVESELFGYEAGAFTGGRQDGNSGKFEEASGGTIFLDEVSELPLQAQAALLRVLQEGEVVRLGGSTPRRLDLRVIAASNRNLSEEIRAGRFRSDLFFRLDVLAISVPPLRERRADVIPLALAFLREAEVEVGRSGLRFSDEAARCLEAWSWPGNVRELRNVVLRAAATAPGSVIEISDLPADVRPRATAGLRPVGDASALEFAAPRPGRPSVDREQTRQALEDAGWNIAQAALRLGVSRMTLYRRIRRFDLQR